MIRKYPQIRGFIDDKIEKELRVSFDAIYDLIENLAQKAQVSLEISTPSSPSSTTNNSLAPNSIVKNNQGVGLNNDTFSQPVLNQGNVLQTPLQTIVPKSTITSNLVIIPGAVPVGGKITITTLDGKSQEVLVP